MYEIASQCRAFLTQEACNQIYSFLLSQKCEDGGFRGRGQKSDLYYTAFATASFMALGKTLEDNSVLGYLEKFTEEKLDFIHLCSLLRCYDLLGFFSYPKISEEKRQKIFSFIEKYRSQDGGYHHESPGSIYASLYGCFLAYQAYHFSRKALPQISSLASSIERLKLQDGSYTNTTTTSAALVLSKAMGKAPCPETISSLLMHRHPSGGFLAAKGSNIPDLLSTCVALYALRVSEYPFQKIRSSSLEFIESHWEETGGFLGTLLDPVADCEYTFYALLGLGSLSDSTTKF